MLTAIQQNVYEERKRIYVVHSMMEAVRLTPEQGYYGNLALKSHSGRLIVNSVAEDDSVGH